MQQPGNKTICKNIAFSENGECLMGEECICKKNEKWLEETEDLSAPASPVEEKREEFATIKRAVGDIFWNHISMSKDGKAIEGNPAVHRIAEYIVANFQPSQPSPVIEIGEQNKKDDNDS